MKTASYDFLNSHNHFILYSLPIKMHLSVTYLDAKTRRNIQLVDFCILNGNGYISKQLCF